MHKVSFEETRISQLCRAPEVPHPGETVRTKLFRGYASVPTMANNLCILFSFLVVNSDNGSGMSDRATNLASGMKKCHDVDRLHQEARDAPDAHTTSPQKNC